MVQFFSLNAQEGKRVSDTLLIQKDSLIVDTILTRPRKISSNAIAEKVTYSTAPEGKIRRDVKNKKVTLEKGAQVVYGEIEIKADSILINMQTNLLFAIGRKDTSGKIVGKPVFKEGSQEFEADQLTYNFKTRKALIKNIVTKQEDGLLHSQFTKLLEDGTSNISKSTYSTCDADTPHFYINLPKARVYPGEKIISGPGNLVLEGIPLPLVIPFGYFPVNTKKAASGILFPRIGQENKRGYSLTEGGYYFAINDYFDFTLKGNAYSNGTWAVTTASTYSKLYKFNGNVLFSYADNITGHKGLDDFSEEKNYRLGWTYNQDAKASPGSRFTASVNMSSSGYDKQNSYAVAEHVTTQRQSSISYSKSWDGTPFNLSMSMNHSQNVKNQTIDMNLPKINFNVGRIYPLKWKNSSGSTKWYQELQFNYVATLDNQIHTTEGNLFTSSVWKDMKNGFKHEAPLSFQLRPIRNFSVSPSLTYTGVLYTQKIETSWDPIGINPATGKKGVVVKDTIQGLVYGQAFSPSISAGYSPQIFGMFKFKPESRIQAIRHVIKPSVSFNYIPSLERQSAKLYRHVQTDTTGLHYTDYSIFGERSIYGTPSLATKSGNVSFGLVNIFEAKVFARDDTTGIPKKVKLIDNFSINTSYNIFADSMNWAPVAMQMRTVLFNNINISANGSFSLYGANSKGAPIGTFYFDQAGKLMRLTNFSTSIDFSLSQLLSKKKDKNKKNDSSGSNAPLSALAQGFAVGEAGSGTGQSQLPGQTTSALRDKYGYSVFDVPWSLTMSYSVNYYKSGLKPTVSQALSFSGNLTLTKKMSITYTSGYDFTGKKLTMTNIGMSRDLHCWQMTFNWVPVGYYKMWNFTIRVKSPVLGDLKYDRRKDFHDTY
jgi:hypothetical protein